jgi:predicted dehydrogenase
MKHGKDVMSDKPGCLSFGELEELRQTVQQTGRIWSVDFSERFEVPAVTLASQLVSEGAIGDVIHTLGLGPHRLNTNSRPDWFFDPNKNGGILADIGSHQIDQFLYFTKSERAEITLASIRNMGHKEFTNFSDFGEISLRSEKANGYIRLDWFTPDALPTWGDGRLFLLGTDGSIEIRKYCDIGSEEEGNYVYLTNGTKYEKIYGGNAGCPYFYNFLVDVVERSETAMPQEHAFRVMELAIEAQEMADGEKRNELI